MNELDEDGDIALKIILSHKCKGAIDSEAVVLSLEATLPFDFMTGEPSLVDVERPGWVDAGQHDEATVVKAVTKVLEKYSSSIRDLACAVDAKGRSCLDIACPTCKTMMLKKLYLHERYEVQLGPPEHRSATSAVYFAKDHINMVDNNVPCEEGSRTIINRDHSPSIALKFMKNRTSSKEKQASERCVSLRTVTSSIKYAVTMEMHKMRLTLSFVTMQS